MATSRSMRGEEECLSRLRGIHGYRYLERSIDCNRGALVAIEGHWLQIQERRKRRAKRIELNRVRILAQSGCRRVESEAVDEMAYPVSS